MRQQIRLEAYFQDLGQKQIFICQNERGAQRILQIFLLRSDRRENSSKMTAMPRFIDNLQSNVYPNWLTLRDISKKPIFWINPPGPRLKTSNLSKKWFKDLKIG